MHKAFAVPNDGAHNQGGRVCVEIKLEGHDLSFGDFGRQYGAHTTIADVPTTAWYLDVPNFLQHGRLEGEVRAVPLMAASPASLFSS